MINGEKRHYKKSSQPSHIAEKHSIQNNKPWKLHNPDGCDGKEERVRKRVVPYPTHREPAANTSTSQRGYHVNASKNSFYASSSYGYSRKRTFTSHISNTNFSCPVSNNSRKKNRLNNKGNV